MEPVQATDNGDIVPPVSCADGETLACGFLIRSVQNTVDLFFILFAVSDFVGDAAPCFYNPQKYDRCCDDRAVQLNGGEDLLLPVGGKHPEVTTLRAHVELSIGIFGEVQYSYVEIEVDPDVSDLDLHAFSFLAGVTFKF